MKQAVGFVPIVGDVDLKRLRTRRDPQAFKKMTLQRDKEAKKIQSKVSSRNN